MFDIEKPWAIKDSSSIKLHWKKTPFFIKTEILWRGESIIIEIKDEFNSKGSTTTYTITHNNQTSVFGTARWMGIGGGFGKRPIIKNKTHILEICGSLKFLTLTDKPLLTEESDVQKKAIDFRRNHQKLLSSLVTKGYEGLTDEEKRYWNSVY